MAERLTTEDDVRISYAMQGAGPGILMVHMLNSNKDAWAPLAQALNSQGFATMAIDLRGHGDSELSWTTFAAQDFKNMALDLESAAKFMKKQGTPIAGIVGASLGANHALCFAAKKRPGLKSVVVLSPGLDYRGVKIAQAISAIDVPLFIVSAKGDMYSAQSSEQLHKTHGTLHMVEGDAHGTRMLDTTLIDNITSWIAQQHK